MSGICGIINLNGAPVDPERLRVMAEAAAHLGPDGIRYWTNGPVGFAHLALHTTAESLREEQPLVARPGDLVLVADARVDNRDELIRTLTSKGHLQQKDPTDADLILAGYEAWGEACPEHILGDFAFAIWDDRTRRLFCARDPFGVRPLFYHRDKQVFLFGSMARQVLAHGAVPARLNERAIAYYLTGKPYNFLTEGTYFEDVWRARPAHGAVLTPSGELRQTRYWDIDRGRQLHYSSDEEYAEELLHLLRQSVKAHARSHRPVAVFTSGGMDSSTIASLLGKMREEGDSIDFRMISFVFGEGHPSDERPYIEAIARRYDVEVHYINGLDHPPFSESLYVGKYDDEPPRWWNDPLWHAGFEQVAHPGCRVALLGQGADSLFTVQNVLFGDLVRQGRLLDCIRELWVIPPRYRRRVALAIADQSIRALAPMWMRKLRRWMPRRGQPGWVNKDLAGPLIADTPELRWGFPNNGFPFAHQTARYYTVSDWLYPVKAAFHRLATPHSLQPGDPYLDRRLVEFALALPVNQCYHRGTTKRVLRNATANVLPDTVRLRQSKTLFDAVLRQGLKDWAAAGDQVWLSEWISVEHGYMNMRPLSQALRACDTTQTHQMAWALWKPLLLEQWLRSIQNRLGN